MRLSARLAVVLSVRAGAIGPAPDTVNAIGRNARAKVRLISHRSFGFHSAAPLIALIYLYCGGISIELPTER